MSQACRSIECDRTVKMSAPGQDAVHGRSSLHAKALAVCAVLNMSFNAHAQRTVGVITGRIVNEATGDGLAQADVLAWAADRFTYNERMPYAISQSDGSFRIENVWPGGYRISIPKLGLSVRNTASSLLVNVRPDEAVAPRQISLAPNGGVVGEVVDESEVPQAASQNCRPACLRRMYRLRSRPLNIRCENLAAPSRLSQTDVL